MFRIINNRDSFYQWDINQKLIIDDETITEVHFCNKTDNCALICEVYTEDSLRLVNVPNILLQNSWDIRVYAYCNNTHTKLEERFKVKARTKPADYVYTETEVLSYEKLEERITDLEEKESAVEERITALEEAEVTVEVEQEYKPESANAASGKAVAEALSVYQPSRVKKILFRLEDNTHRGQLIISLGNYTNNTINASVSFFNPRLLCNGVDIVNPMTTDYYNTSSAINYKGYWNKRGTVNTTTRKDNYILVNDDIARNTWSCIRYFQNDMVLSAGIYELSVEYWGDIEQLPTMEVTFEGKKISIEDPAVREIKYHKIRENIADFELKRNKVYTFTVKDSDNVTAYIIDTKGQIVKGVASNELKNMTNGFIICSSRCSAAGLTGTFSLLNPTAFVADRWDWDIDKAPYYLRTTTNAGIDIWEM